MIANSMYNLIFFKCYNVYCPRCVISGIGCDRMSLKLYVAVDASQGFRVVNGDTDSGMYNIEFDSRSKDKIHGYIAQIMNNNAEVNEVDIRELKRVLC